MNKFNTLFNQIVSEQEYDSSQFDPRLNKADVSNRPDHGQYKEPEDDLQNFKNRERNAGLGPADRDSKDRFNPFYYAFKNDIFEKKGKVFWVYAGPKLSDELTMSVKRKFKDITSLVKPGRPGALNGQEFQGKFNKFKIIRIEPEEQRQRHEETPSDVMGAFYKAIPIK